MTTWDEFTKVAPRIADAFARPGRGFLADVGDEVARVPAFPVPVVDATGCGDAFSASRLSRRSLLAAGAGAAVMPVLNACGKAVQTPPQPPAIILSGLAIAQVLQRLQEIQERYPAAEGRRGRADRWDVRPADAES